MNTSSAVGASLGGFAVPTDVASLLSLISVVVLGLGASCSVVMYARRLCTGRDFVSDCIIGKSVVHLSVDTNGDGKIVASEKLVVDLNARKVAVQATGQESPGTDLAPGPVTASTPATTGIAIRRNSPRLNSSASAVEIEEK